MKTELVTSLKRRATEIISELQERKAPVLITQHGRPAAYLVDVESFEEMERRVTVLEGIARGERALEDGRTLTQRQARARMKRWLRSSG
jgi:prevent-host-death family protein